MLVDYGFQLDRSLIAKIHLLLFFQAGNIYICYSSITKIVPSDIDAYYFKSLVK